MSQSSEVGRLVVVAFVVVAAASGTVSATNQAETVTLTVSVVTAGGNPVGSADVAATWDGGSSDVTTAANGKAFVDVPANATVRLDVTHPDYVRNEPYVVSDASERSVEVPMFPRGRIVATVRDSDGPVAGASVVVRQSGDVVASGRTDADGRFDTGAVEQDEYGVTVVERGYYRNATAVTVDGTERVTVALRSGSVTLEVRVRDPHFSPPEPVGNATIRVGSVGEVRTLASGETTVRVPVNADLDLTVSKAAYEANETTVRIRESDAAVNLSLSRTPALNLTPVSNRVVAGERVVVEVVDEYGDPAADATVLRNGSEAATTNAEGRATFRIESPGQHELQARRDGVESDPVTIDALAGEQTAPSETTTAAPTTATDTPTTSGTGSPGFGPLAALAAVLAAAALLARRRRRTD
jgi:PGF-CTERM protein